MGVRRTNVAADGDRWGDPATPVTWRNHPAVSRPCRAASLPNGLQLQASSAPPALITCTLPLPTLPRSPRHALLTPQSHNKNIHWTHLFFSNSLWVVLQQKAEHVTGTDCTRAHSRFVYSLHCTTPALDSPTALRFLRLGPSSSGPALFVHRQTRRVSVFRFCNKQHCHSVKISWLWHGKNRREPCWRVRTRILHSIDNSNKENPIHLYRAFRCIQQLGSEQQYSYLLYPGFAQVSTNVTRLYSIKTINKKYVCPLRSSRLRVPMSKTH